jgi:NADH:ubiquinone oxidoreductase subunit 6 (subunit J)
MPASFVAEPVAPLLAMELRAAVGSAVFAVLGGAGVYLLLPRPRGRSVVAGGVLALLALLALGVLLSPVPLTVETFLFYVFAAVAVISGCLLITQRNPARAALSFALVVLSSCGLFLLQAAPFLMAATVIIYAGAIIVTFLFVLMLAQQEGPSDADARSHEPVWSVFAGAALLGTLLYLLAETYSPAALDGFADRLQGIDRDAAQVQALADQPPEEADGPLQKIEADLAGFQKWLDERVQPTERPEETRASHLPDDGRRLRAALEDASAKVAGQRNNAQKNGQPVRADELQAALGQVRDAAAQAVAGLGALQPSERRPLSEFSGPRANLPPQALRRDAEGRPELPAENVGFLGRSLFTDYLLPVELGGTLLLVATVGAIAIATRRAERLP